MEVPCALMCMWPRFFVTLTSWDLLTSETELVQLVNFIKLWFLHLRLHLVHQDALTWLLRGAVVTRDHRDIVVVVVLVSRELVPVETFLLAAHVAVHLELALHVHLFIKVFLIQCHLLFLAVFFLLTLFLVLHLSHHIVSHGCFQFTLLLNLLVDCVIFDLTLHSHFVQDPLVLMVVVSPDFLGLCILELILFLFLGQLFLDFDLHLGRCEDVAGVPCVILVREAAELTEFVVKFKLVLKVDLV